MILNYDENTDPEQWNEQNLRKKMIYLYLLRLAQVILLFIAGFYSVETVAQLRHEKFRKHPLMRTKRRVFTILMIGILFLAMAYAIQYTCSYISGSILPVASDILFIIAYLDLIIAFVVFWFESRKFHTLPKQEYFFMIGVASIIIMLLYYFFVHVFRPESHQLTLEIIMVYFYPLAASFLFFTTVIIYPTFKDKVIRSPLWYLSSAIFVNFVAEILVVYTKFYNLSQTAVIIYQFLFLISASYFLLGFYASYRKYR